MQIWCLPLVPSETLDIGDFRSIRALSVYCIGVKSTTEGNKASKLFNPNNQQLGFSGRCSWTKSNYFGDYTITERHVVLCITAMISIVSASACQTIHAVQLFSSMDLTTTRSYQYLLQPDKRFLANILGHYSLTFIVACWVGVFVHLIYATQLF